MSDAADVEDMRCASDADAAARDVISVDDMPAVELRCARGERLSDSGLC